MFSSVISSVTSIGDEPATFVPTTCPIVGICASTFWVQTLAPNAVGVISMDLPVGQTTCNCASVGSPRLFVEGSHVTSPAFIFVGVVNVYVHPFTVTCAVAKPNAVQEL